jgi:hypothetical protein
MVHVFKISDAKIKVLEHTNQNRTLISTVFAKKSKF